MPKPLKKLLILCGGVLGLSILLLLVSNLYLQSEGVQGRIRQAASDALGAPIAIRGTYFTPWGGFVVRGLSVPNPEDPSKNLLEATALRMRIALWPLLQGRITVRRITLENPKLIARQTPNREWVVLVPPPPQSEIPVTIPPPAKATKSASPKTFRVVVENIRLRGGNIEFIDAKGRTVLRLEHLEGDAFLNDDLTSRGNFRIGRIEISRALRPKNLTGSFTWDGQSFLIPDLAGTLAGGELTGTYSLHTANDPTFDLTASVQGANLKKLAEDAGGDSRTARGILNAQIALSGDPRDSQALAGTASLDMIGARFTPVDFLVQFGQLLGVEELQLLNLAEATSQFTIADGQVKVERIFLKSENLILSGTGTAQFDGKIALDGMLHVNRKLQRQLRPLVGKNFVQLEDPEYKTLEFKVTNTLSNPKTDLLDKLVGIRIGEDVGGLLRNLFGNPQPKKDK